MNIPVDFMKATNRLSGHHGVLKLSIFMFLCFMLCDSHASYDVVMCVTCCTAAYHCTSAPSAFFLHSTYVREYYVYFFLCFLLAVYMSLGRHRLTFPRRPRESILVFLHNSSSWWQSSQELFFFQSYALILVTPTQIFHFDITPMVNSILPCESNQQVISTILLR